MASEEGGPRGPGPKLRPRPLPAPPQDHGDAALLTLAPARVHEAEGPGRRSFALFQATRFPGPLIWILPGHAPQTPFPPGLPAGVTERLILLRPASETDLLWSVEEALRARAAGLVVAEPEKPLSLTAGRRLQLAAEAGGTTGLMLIREGAGSNAAETRWLCRPLPAEGADSTLHAWSLNKNKKGTTRVVTVNWNGASPAFDLVSPPRQRDRPAPEPGGGRLRPGGAGG